MKKVQCFDCGTEIEVKEMARKACNWVCSSCKEKRVRDNLTRYQSTHYDDIRRRERTRYHTQSSIMRKRALTYLHNLSPIERDLRRSYIREYHRINRKQRQLYSKDYYKQPHAKIARTFRARQARLIKSGLMLRKAHTEMLNGCSWTQLKQHLESQFKPGMTWDNHGTRWHIDHIKPIASFDLTLVDEQQKCWHYTNLQPLFAEDNLTKGSKNL